ncbi:MAG: AbrB/MazE/SpoVT family DNA-binding domain-containing protein [Gammaproteobacteria bacterium]|nr:AbrB/MazE/SpoVT family DNA-binding domain-containing protein [Gammaproteobacteria bacterium]MBT6042790.1 AbrB/MazE/SpoVT family DNA-binding domain-containing protein [Gammaproteobacteria bacterium]
MSTVTVSPKFQVVIPKEIREPMGIHSGQKMQMIQYQNRIELIPIKPIKQLRGCLILLMTAMRSILPNL